MHARLEQLVAERVEERVDRRLGRRGRGQPAPPARRGRRAASSCSANALSSGDRVGAGDQVGGRRSARSTRRRGRSPPAGSSGCPPSHVPHRLRGDHVADPDHQLGRERARAGRGRPGRRRRPRARGRAAPQRSCEVGSAQDRVAARARRAPRPCAASSGSRWRPARITPRAAVRRRSSANAATSSSLGSEAAPRHRRQRPLAATPVARERGSCAVTSPGAGIGRQRLGQRDVQVHRARAGARATRRPRAPPSSGSGAAPCRRRAATPSSQNQRTARRRTASAGRSSGRRRGRAAPAGGRR